MFLFLNVQYFKKYPREATVGGPKDKPQLQALGHGQRLLWP